MRSIFIIFKKEMKDLLRDRRTIMAMIVLPIILVPVIFTVVSRVSLSPGDSSKGFKEIKLAIQDNGNGEDLVKRFQRRKDLKLFEGLSPQEIHKWVTKDSIDFGLIISKDFDRKIEEGKTGELELLYKAEGRRDTFKYSSISSTISDFRKVIITERLAEKGTDLSILNPTSLDKQNLHKEKDSIGAFFGAIPALFFILFSFMGAMYPAIDLFTGEKERGTIETLLVLPANRFQILIGKLLVIVTAGVISGLLTFFGIFLFLKINQDLPFVTAILNLKSVLWMILMMIPLTTFFAGVLIPITIYAKSFKEAQSLLQPFIIVIIFPVIFGMFPSAELNFMTALIPILNVTLASKEIVGGTIDYGLLTVVFISLFMLAAIGVVIAKRWFGNEANIFRS